MRHVCIAILGFGSLLAAGLHAASINVTLNTTPLIGHPAGPFALEFEIDDGSSFFSGASLNALAEQQQPTGDDNNLVVLSNFLFTGGGPVGSPTLDGDGASGSIASTIRLADASATDTFIQPFTPGPQLKFRVTYTNNVDLSPIGDTFSFAILDSSGLEIPTEGGTFLDALLEIDFDSFTPDVLTFATDSTIEPDGGGPPIAMGPPTFGAVTNTVPEPGTLVLFGVGFLALGAGKRNWRAYLTRRQRFSRLAGRMFGLFVTFCLLVVSSSALSAAPAIQITSPSAGPVFSTSAPEIAVLGIASSPGGIERVLVVSDRGYTGLAVLTSRGASGTIAWRSGQLVLQPGANRVTVTAMDTSGGSATATIEIDQIVPGVSPPEPVLYTGVYRGKMVTYQVINGMAVAEGDMVLGPVNSWIPSTTEGPAPKSIATNTPSRLWPKVGGVAQVPYVETRSSQAVKNSIASFNVTFAGIIQWVPRTTQADYVNIDLNNQSPNSCYADVGNPGGASRLEGSATCDVPTLLHEMGHNIGLYHEQSRSDRDNYLTIDFSNIPLNKQSNYTKELANGMDIGLYDFRSIMQYGPRGFTKNGNPEMESIPVGIPFGVSPNFDEGDIDTIKRLYAAAPTAVTIASNPSGLQAIVDGATITTPQTFTFALNSTHNLGVSGALQTLGGRTYFYGRWNDNTNANHSITIAPGSGISTSPASSPAITVYMANFVQLVPFNPQVQPANAGTIIPNPAPLTFQGSPGQFYINRQLVSLQATPNPGSNFYGWTGGSFFSPIVVPLPGLASNPVLTVSDNLGATVTAQFTARPLTSIGTNITTNGVISATVDGNPVVLPNNFADDQDGPAWAPGTMHSVSAASPVGPTVDNPNTRYLFANWNDGGAQTRQVAASAAGVAAFIANYSTQFKLFPGAMPGCAGSLGVTPPPPPDGFFAAGTPLTFIPTANPPWMFAGWGGTLSGSANPLTANIANETAATVFFNTAATPLTISNLMPATAVAGGQGFNLTVNGTGFAPNPTVFVNGSFSSNRAVTFISSTALTVAITPDDIKAPGIVTVSVQNGTPDGCAISASATPLLVTL